MNSQTAFFAAILFLAGFAMLAWYGSGQSAITSSPNVENDNSPDFLLHDLAIEEYASTGELSYSIQARRLAHYPISDNASITAPLITLYPANQTSQWFAKADHAEIEKSGKLLILKDSVTLFNNKAEPNRITMSASDLTINIDQEIAYTDSAVLIENALGRVHSKGFEANLVTNTVKLISQVEGVIDPNAAR